MYLSIRQGPLCYSQFSNNENSPSEEACNGLRRPVRLCGPSAQPETSDVVLLNGWQEACAHDSVAKTPINSYYGPSHLEL